MPSSDLLLEHALLRWDDASPYSNHTEHKKKKKKTTAAFVYVYLFIYFK